MLDCIQEAGRSIEQALRIWDRVRRDPLMSKKLREIQALVDGSSAESRRLRRRIRRTAGCGPYRPPIVVHRGNAPPVLTGEPPVYTFRDGGECRNPGAARRAGYRIEYRRSTLLIHVGVEWVMRYVL